MLLVGVLLITYIHISPHHSITILHHIIINPIINLHTHHTIPILHHIKGTIAHNRALIVHLISPITVLDALERALGEGGRLPLALSELLRAEPAVAGRHGRLAGTEADHAARAMQAMPG